MVTASAPLESSPASPRVLFGVMSATQPLATLAQLVDALAPHPVLVHHDWTKQASFPLERPNARLVPQPKMTGWGSWGLVQAIVHTLQYALAESDFDYFQLLSPTCLPIRPLAAFQDYLRHQTVPVHADLIPVHQDPDWLMNFGYRLFAASDSLPFKTLRWLRRLYFGPDPELVQMRSLSVLRRRLAGASWWRRQAAQAAWLAMQQAARGRWGRHPFDAGLSPWVGSIWFGARRSVCEALVRYTLHDPAAQRFERLYLVDEVFLGSYWGNAGWAVGPSNHVVNAFDAGGHPGWLETADWRMLAASPRFFARKFPESITAPIRRWALARSQARFDPVLGDQPMGVNPTQAMSQPKQ